MKKLFTLLMIFVLLGTFANAQVSMTTTGSYYQDFNSLLNTGTTNKWKNDSTLLSWYGQFRSGTLTVYRADNGGSATGAIYSYGTTGLTERSLGSVSSGTPDTIVYGVLLQNNSTSTITDMAITYVGEQWRCGGKLTQDSLKFFYKIDAAPIIDLTPTSNSTWTPVAALHFASPTNTTPAAALNGNIDTNQVIFNNITIPALSIPAGSYIMFRWFDPNDAGNDHGMGVDSLTVAWTVPAGGNTIATGTIAGSPFNVTDVLSTPVSVPYTITGTYNAGNIFTAYLSDAAGSFASETAIGTLASQINGTISANIPALTASGTGYRIRVKASDPIATSPDNGSDLTVILTIPDLIPPVAIKAYATSLSNIVVVFNESLLQASAETAANYTFHTAVTGTATLRPTLDSVSLVLSTPLTTAVTDTLFVTAINDILGNAMTLTYKFPVVYGTIVPPTMDTVVYWNFPDATRDDSIADGGIAANLLKVINREPSFTDTLSFVFAGLTTKSVRSTGWDAGTGTKYYQIEFTTALYDSIRFSSKHKSSNTGPRRFKADYSLDGTIWTPLSGGDYVVGNNWTSGVINNFKLPVDCYNAASVHLRWIMTSDSAVNGTGLVAAGGASNMDDIYVFGRYNPTLGVNCPTDGKALEFSVYPNPANGSFNVQIEKNADVRVDILSITGQVMRSENRSGNRFSFDLEGFSKGIYIVRMINLADQSVSIRRLSVQ